MIDSMTAFARSTVEGVAGTATWELRSVNHRYLEMHYRLPDAFRELEPTLREHIKAVLQRGKVECHLKWQPTEHATGGAQIHSETLSELLSLEQGVLAANADRPRLSVADILKWPNVVTAATPDSDVLGAQVIDAFDAALKTLSSNRSREGEALKALIEQRLLDVEATVQSIEQSLPDAQATYREKLLTRFDELKVTIDEARLEQELVLMLQRLDVTEEIDRLKTHVTEVRHALAGGSPCGRRLDFLMQEMNREANTFGSKIANQSLSQVAIDLKVLIEQMREQIQNIE